MTRRILIALVFLSIAGAGYSQITTTNGVPEDFARLYNTPEEAEFYYSVVKIAEDSLGLRSLPATRGRRFATDCIGFVRYVYYKAGLDLTAANGDGSRGVDTLYHGLSERGFVFTNALPRPGDIIFFDNTYDANRNGRWDDPLSHIGIVESLGPHNTVNYIHLTTGSGVTRDQINMDYPYTHAFRQSDGNLLVINSHLRRDRGEGFERRCYISSFFFHAYAHIPVLKEN